MAMEKELNIYNSTISIVAIVALVVIAVLVKPDIPSKGKKLPPLKGSKVAFAGKLKTGKDIFSQKAKLLRHRFAI